MHDTQFSSLELESFFTKINSSILSRDSNGTPISNELFRECINFGLYSFGIHSALKNCTPFSWGKHLERIGYHCLDSGLALLISLRAGLANTIIGANITPINKLYESGLRSGETIPAFAYTDGADPFSFNTQAKKTEGGYLLAGKKLYVTGGATADLFLVYATKTGGSGSDLGVFLVKRQTEGFHSELADLAGLRTAGIATITLNNCFVPNDHILQENDGLSHVQKFLNERRLFLVSPLIGQMQRILDYTIDAMNERSRYGAPLTSMQYVQAQIGRMYTLHQMSRTALYSGLERQGGLEFDIYWDAANSSAKFYIVETAIEFVHIAQHLLGGDGYLRSQHIERYCRDFAGYIPGGGSQDTLLVDLGINAITSRQISSFNKIA